MLNLNSDLKNSKQSVDVKSLKENSLCIAYDKINSIFYRVKVEKVDKDQVFVIIIKKFLLNCHLICLKLKLRYCVSTSM